METARSSSLQCRLVDTGAELKLKPFGSRNSQISIGNPPLLPTPQVRQPNLLKEKGLRVSGAASGRCTKRYPLLLPLLLRKLGAAVTIALHPAPSRRPSLCSYRAQAGRPRASRPRRVCPEARLPGCKQTGFAAARTETRGRGRESKRGGRQSRVRGAAAATA